jgi:hypothetical protein
MTFIDVTEGSFLLTGAVYFILWSLVSVREIIRDNN